MPAKGREYEQFVFEKFRTLFPDSTVTFDDHIMGRQSRFPRQIDISIKTRAGGEEILYIVDCKDHRKPADINTLGAFSALMRDVGATKGFLICTSGFARTNYQYAQSEGIELLTVEDVQHAKWWTDMRVPLIIIKKNVRYVLSGTFTVNFALAIKKRLRPETRPDLTINSLISFDGGVTSTTIQDWTKSWITRAKAFVRDTVTIELPTNLKVYLSGVWVDCQNWQITLFTERRHFLKYITPDEYSQVRDHCRDATLPTHIRIGGPSEPDDSFTEIDVDDVPANPVFIVIIEDSTELEPARTLTPLVPSSMEQDSVAIPFTIELPTPEFWSVPNPASAGGNS
jgi:hypothetical protein